jgi:excisionase family DNA binding protein
VDNLTPPANSSTVDEFCKRQKISIAKFYELLKQGKAPRTMRVGRTIRISFEAERDWMRKLEEEFAEEAKSVEAQRRREHARRIAKISLESGNHTSKNPDRRKKRAA